MPLQTPWVDVRSVGAGGGSIAHIEQGLLYVGPDSAGADPGPVCYGRGGREPTVTDAALTLGMLARETLASGLALDRRAAHEALTRVGAQAGLTAEELARGVMRLASANMASAIRAVTIEVGEDPRRAALLTYGGAGPLFGSLLAHELQIKTIVLPRYAGNFSAWGLLEQDMVRSAARTIVTRVDDDGIRAAQNALAELFARLDARVGRTVAGHVVHEAELDLRYPGQEYTLAIPVPLAGGLIGEPPESISERFGALYEHTYGHRFEREIDLVSVRAIERTVLPRTGSESAPLRGEVTHRDPIHKRAFSFVRDEWLRFVVIERDSLAPGDRFDGPAIVIEDTTTSYLDVGFSAVVHASGAIIVDDTEQRDRVPSLS
jgi:N-methylhydantoinase A